jgi:hypothetical protein
VQFPLHESPLPDRTNDQFANKKAPRDSLGLSPALFLAKSAGLCGKGG